jgi:uncharacterized phage protein (TIGR02218 family)
MKIEVYKFQAGVEFWRYTSATRDMTFGTETFTAVPVERGTYKSTDAATKNDIEIKLPRTNVLIQRILTDRPASPILVNVYRVTDGATMVAMWKGRVISTALEGHIATLTCENSFTSVARPGLRAMYQTMCRHALYSSGCNIDRYVYRVPCQIVAASSNQLTIPQAAYYASDYFKAGFIIHNDDAHLMILSNAGDKVYVERAFTETGYGFLYPGCDHTITGCTARFANSYNFGGFPYIPQTTPFSGLGGSI